MPGTASPVISPARFVESDNKDSSVGHMTQEMIDLVDNLIDASPNSRVDGYNKFKLKIKPTKEKGEESASNSYNADAEGSTKNRKDDIILTASNPENFT